VQYVVPAGCDQGLPKGLPGATAPDLPQRGARREGSAREDGRAEGQGMPDRILVVNPNSSSSCTSGIDTALSGFRAPGLPRIEVMQMAGGPPAIVTWRDWFGVAEPLCRLVEREPAGAYVIACVSDPGVDAIRTITPARSSGRCAAPWPRRWRAPTASA
jgi:hypothetical protein